jgi:glycosyltransferase involved in cell wall biosynthesis
VAGDHFSIERLFDAVSRALPAERFEVRRLVCPFESKGLLSRLALMIWAAFHQGDVNHVTGDVNFLGLLMRKARTVLTIHDSASMNRLMGFPRWLYGVFWLRLPIWRAGCVTVISEKTLHETLFYVNADKSKFVVVPNCLTLDIASQPRAWPTAKPRILVVGTKPNKNLTSIIKALQGIQCKLVVVGPLSDAHRELIAANEIDLENHVDLNDAAIAEQYSAADLVVFVPTYEGFGLPILEAQAAARPLITSKRSPMQEVAGPGSCLVDPDNVSEISEAVHRVIQELAYRDALVAAGSINVEHYSPAAIARRYAAIYEKIVNNKAL